jgi:hypothetical protein
MAAPPHFTAGQRWAPADAGSRISARAVAGLAQEGKLSGPDGKRLATFAVSETTVRRAAADLREHQALTAAGSPGGVTLQDFEAKLVEHLAAEWRSYEDRRGDLKPAQRRFELKDLAHLQRTVARTVAGAPPAPGQQESGGGGEPAPDLLDDLAQHDLAQHED